MQSVSSGFADLMRNIHLGCRLIAASTPQRDAWVCCPLPESLTVSSPHTARLCDFLLQLQYRDPFQEDEKTANRSHYRSSGFFENFHVWGLVKGAASADASAEPYSNLRS